MFTALYVVNNNEWNIFSFSLCFYIIILQDNPIYINVINKLGQKYGSPFLSKKRKKIITSFYLTILFFFSLAILFLFLRTVIITHKCAL